MVGPVSWFRRVPEAAPGSTCGACGQPCSETDRGLVVMHAACVKWVKNVVASQGDFPRRDYLGGESDV